MPPSPLPPLYDRWALELLQQPIPPERGADCADCPMCPADADDGPSERFFNPRTRCCTYHPPLPAFLVGRILAGPDSGAARALVEEQIAARTNATPLGLKVPPLYALTYRHARAAFGRSLKLRCPYFEEADGRCGIWESRGAVCATWFCKHERGAVGGRFWGALRSLLRVVERQLSLSAALASGIGETSIALLLPPAFSCTAPPSLEAAQLDGEPEAPAEQVWGRWAGREREYYVGCWEQISALSFAEAARRCGPEADAWSRVVRGAFAELVSTELPSRLEVGAFAVRAGGAEESVQLVGYSHLDPLEVPRAVLEILPRFGGQPWHEVAAALEEEGLDVAEDLLRLLADFEVLVSPEQRGDGGLRDGQVPAP